MGALYAGIALHQRQARDQPLFWFQGRVGAAPPTHLRTVWHGGPDQSGGYLRMTIPSSGTLRNRLLAALPEQVFGHLGPHLDPVSLSSRQIL